MDPQVYRAATVARMTPTDDERWADWAKRFEAAYQDVTTLYLDRFVWQNMVAMLQANSDIHHSGLVNNYLARTYSGSLALGIRRQTDLDSRTASLAYVLHDIAAHSYVATQQR